MLSDEVQLDLFISSAKVVLDIDLGWMVGFVVMNFDYAAASTRLIDALKEQPANPKIIFGVSP